ncbi:hypothetical protein ONZ45_g4324 [Pleurotus djamor]|nr:hypothetical protein ONZ45_g4324 [Pleurotus djamor]
MGKRRASTIDASTQSKPSKRPRGADWSPKESDPIETDRISVGRLERTDTACHASSRSGVQSMRKGMRESTNDNHLANEDRRGDLEGDRSEETRMPKLGAELRIQQQSKAYEGRVGTSVAQYFSVPVDFEALRPRHHADSDDSTVDDPFEPSSDDPCNPTENPAGKVDRDLPQQRAEALVLRGSSVELSSDDSEHKEEGPPSISEPPKNPTRKQKRQFRKRLITRPLRSLQRATNQTDSTSMRKSCSQKYVDQAEVLQIPTCDSSLFPHVSTSWTGPKKEEATTGLESVPSHFHLIRWDPSTKTTLLVDNQRRVFAVMSAGPQDSGQTWRRGWDNVIRGCEAIIRTTRKRCTFKEKDLDHKRGLFPALAIGVTRGPGSGIPTVRRAANVATKTALDDLLDDPSMRALATYQSQLLHLHCPVLGHYYRTTFDEAIAHKPDLRRNFEKSDFASLTVNFGPQTVCKKHLDTLNLAWGWCAVTALGNYDYRKGGHLVLWNLGLVLEFPPGCTINIPSATLYHSNTPIAHHETRYSVTQYSGGEIFRWVHNGFRMAKELPPPTDEENEKIWRDGVAMYRTV